MKIRLPLFLLLSLWALSSARGESVFVATLFSDASKTEDFILVDDTSKIDELKPVVIISRDGRYREQHGILHVYDGRYIYLSERLKGNFVSGARLYQDK